MTQTIDIFLGEHYYGSIKIKFFKPPFTRNDEDIQQEIIKRLPTLKGKPFRIAL